MQPLLETIKKLENQWKQDLKKTEFHYISSIIKNNQFNYYLNTPPRRNWIKETLSNAKQTRKLENCSTLVMVGSGINPYSLIDLHKDYPNIKMIGIDWDLNCVLISSFLLEKCSIHDIKIIHMNGINYDYSYLENEDLVFLSIDIESINEIYTKIIQTSRAQPFICAPGKYKWLKNNYRDYLSQLINLSKK